MALHEHLLLGVWRSTPIYPRSATPSPYYYTRNRRLFVLVTTLLLEFLVTSVLFVEAPVTPDCQAAVLATTVLQDMSLGGESLLDSSLVVGEGVGFLESIWASQVVVDMEDAAWDIQGMATRLEQLGLLVTDPPHVLDADDLLSRPCWLTRNTSWVNANTGTATVQSLVTGNDQTLLNFRFKTFRNRWQGQDLLACTHPSFNSWAGISCSNTLLHFPTTSFFLLRLGLFAVVLSLSFAIRRLIKCSYRGLSVRAEVWAYAALALVCVCLVPATLVVALRIHALTGWSDWSEYILSVLTNAASNMLLDFVKMGLLYWLYKRQKLVAQRQSALQRVLLR